MRPPPVGAGQQRGRGLAVVDRGQLVTDVGQARQRRERALAACAGRATAGGPRAASRAIQIGGWWRDDDGLVARGRGVARVGDRPPHPGDELDVGLAPGRAERVEQVRAVPRVRAGAVAARRTSCPRSTFPASMTRSSMVMARPCAAAIGAAVSWARSSGEETTAAMSWSARCVGGEVGHPAAERRRGGSRAAGRRAAGGGCATSPWRSRCTTVRVGGDAGAHAPIVANQSVPAAAARRRGQGPTTRSTAASSWAAETNHASNALRRQVHARLEHRVEEPAVNAAVSWAFASS